VSDLHSQEEMAVKRYCESKKKTFSGKHNVRHVDFAGQITTKKEQKSCTEKRKFSFSFFARQDYPLYLSEIKIITRLLAASTVASYAISTQATGNIRKATLTQSSRTPKGKGWLIPQTACKRCVISCLG